MLEVGSSVTNSNKDWVLRQKIFKNDGKIVLEFIFFDIKYHQNCKKSENIWYN